MDSLKKKHNFSKKACFAKLHANPNSLPQPADIFTRINLAKSVTFCNSGGSADHFNSLINIDHEISMNLMREFYLTSTVHVSKVWEKNAEQGREKEQ